MAQKNRIIKTHCAAFYFSHISRDLEEISVIFGVSKDTIRNWSKSSEWADTLEILGYDGDRSFIPNPTRDTARDAGECFEQAKVVYQNAIHAGIPTHQLASFVGETLDVNPRRIRDWAKKYNWRQTE